MHPQNSSKFPKYANPAISEPRTTLHPITHRRNLFFEIFNAKNQAQYFDNEWITPNLVAKGRFFCNQNKSLFADLGLRSPTHLLYICSVTKWTARCARIDEQFGGQRGGIKPWALAGV